MTKVSVFTSESVSEGHPDKVADQISDAILDALLREDKHARVAVETLVKDNNVVIAGEISSTANIDYEAVVRATIAAIGYNEPELGFDAKNCKVTQLISQQSPDISQGVTEGEGTFKEQGAGDQGLMFGGASNQTKELMPLPIQLSQQLIYELAQCRKRKEVDFLKPDAKVQLSVEYVGLKPQRLQTIVLSTQHSPSATQEQIEDFVRNVLVPRVVPEGLVDENTTFLVNPTGKFVTGGPVGDCGLTGRKIIVDTYGGWFRHGGGAFSGKDPSKVDRSAAYATRYVAKNIVAAGLADEAEVQLSYAIGYAEPTSIRVDTHGTGKVNEEELAKVVGEVFNLTPRGIIEELGLLNPIFRETAAHGHFGRTPGEDGSFSWERTDKVEALKAAFDDIKDCAA